MISDAKKIPLEVVTEHFFSCRMIFFSRHKIIFFFLHEKILCQEKKSWGKKKMVCHFGIFLASEKKSVSVAFCSLFRCLES